MVKKAAAKRSPAARKSGDGVIALAVSSEEKIARLLGLLVTRDVETSAGKVKLLRNIGFSITEIALMLDISENAVAVADHRARKSPS